MPPDWMGHNHKATRLFTLRKWEWKEKRSRWKSSRKGQAMDSAHFPAPHWVCFQLFLFLPSISALLWKVDLFIDLSSEPCFASPHSKSQMSLAGWQPAEAEQGCLLHFIRNWYLCSEESRTERFFFLWEEPEGGIFSTTTTASVF